MIYDKIENLFTIINGYAFNSQNYSKSGIEVIRITNVQKGYLSTEDKKFYPKDEQLNYCLLKENDILISLTGNVGRVAVVKKEHLPAYLNQRVACLRSKKNDSIDQRYLFNFLNSSFFEKICIKNSNGVAQKNMSTVWLKNFRIPLPAMEEQKKIAGRLDAVSDLLAKQKQLLAEQDTLIQSLFYDMFGDPIKNNKGWKIDELQNVATSRLGKMLDAKKQTGKNNRFYLANQNVKWFDFDFKDLRKMDFNEEDQKEFKLENGDVLVCEGGDVGRSAIWKSNLKECYFQKALHRIRCNLKKIVPIFLVRLFYTISLHNGFDKIVGNKATIAHLTGVKLKTLKIPVPPLELQEKFAAIVEQIESEKSKIKSAIAETQTLFNALMAEYFEE
ncbi:MAG: restriction endonuclease subunit S [Alphaproteobacteria bacterium]|nr:restriction endonuclease subunit S [Alphaproteobacteria bacterium]